MLVACNIPYYVKTRGIYEANFKNFCHDKSSANMILFSLIYLKYLNKINFKKARYHTKKKQ